MPQRSRNSVWEEMSTYARKVMGIERTTFVTDEDEVIQRICRNVKVTRHADEVPELVRTLG